MSFALADNDRRCQIVASSGQTRLTGDFALLDASELAVTRLRGETETVLALGDDYTIDGLGKSNGFFLDLVDAAAADDLFTLEGATSLASTDGQRFSTKGDITGAALNTGFDRLRMALMEVRSGISRALHVRASDPGLEPIIVALARAGKLARWGSLAAGAPLGASDLDEAAVAAAVAAYQTGTLPELPQTMWALNKAAARAMFAEGVVLPDGQPLFIGGKAGGWFIHDAGDTDSDDDDAIILVDAHGRRFLRDHRAGVASPYWWNGEGDGATDDSAALTQASAWLSGKGGGFVDLGGVAWKVVASPAVQSAGTRFGNGKVLYDEVDGWQNIHHQTYYAGIVAEGAQSAILAHLTEPSRRGAMEVVIDTDPATIGLAAGTMVKIGMSPPVIRAAGLHASDAHTINVNTTTGLPSVGFLLNTSSGEVLAYTATASTAITVRSAPEGRGARGTTAAQISNNSALVELHHGKWAISRRNPARRSEVTFVQGSYLLESGKWVLILRHALDAIYSPTQGAWIRKITPVANVSLGEDLQIIGSSSYGRPGGSEVGFYYHLTLDAQIDGSVIAAGADSNGSLDECFHTSVVAPSVKGKADNSVHDGYYGIEIKNGCQWTNIALGTARNAYKFVTMWTQNATDGANGNYSGFPRHTDIIANTIDNAGEPWSAAHEAFEAHCYVEHLRFSDNSGSDALYGITLEGGQHISITGGEFARWVRAAIAVDGAYVLRNVKIGNCLVGPRTLLAGSARLATSIDDDDTTIVVTPAAAAAALHDLAGSSDDMIDIEGEKIALGSMQVDGVTFTGCVRHIQNTTATPHDAGARILPFGREYATPVNLALEYCDWWHDDPDTQTAYLTQAETDPGSGTLHVSNLAAFPDASATTPREGQIEGENADRYHETEVFSYTGRSGSSGAGTLTGVVRGLYGSTVTNHSENAFVKPFALAVADVRLENMTVTHDVNRSAIAITGYVPTADCELHRVAVRWNGALRYTDNPIMTQPHGLRISQATTHNCPLPIRTYGNNSQIVFARGYLAKAEGGSGNGALARLEGSNSVARYNDADGHYNVVQLASGASATAEVTDNFGRRLGSVPVSDGGGLVRSERNRSFGAASQTFEVQLDADGKADFRTIPVGALVLIRTHADAASQSMVQVINALDGAYHLRSHGGGQTVNVTAGSSLIYLSESSPVAITTDKTWLPIVIRAGIVHQTGPMQTTTA